MSMGGGAHTLVFDPSLVIQFKIFLIDIRTFDPPKSSSCDYTQRLPSIEIDVSLIPPPMDEHFHSMMKLLGPMLDRDFNPGSPVDHTLAFRALIA